MDVRPLLSLPITLFVPPNILGPLQVLGARVQAAWVHIVRATVSRDVALDRDRASEVLARLALEMVGSSEQLKRLLRVAGRDPLVFEPAQALQRDTLQYAIDRIDLSDGASRLPVTVEHLEDLRAIGTFLGRLNRGRPTSDAGQTIRDAISARGWLVDSPVTDPRTTTAPGDVVHLGHATLLADLGERILIDPWFFPERDGMHPPRLGGLDVDAVFLTHHHWDHVDIPTLLLLDKDTPIYLPDQASAPRQTVSPKTAMLLEALGFTRVEPLPHGRSVRFREGRVVAAPFTGEDPTKTGFVGNTYVLVHGESASLVHVDCGPDVSGRSLVSDGTMRRLTSRFGPFSHVFATRRQERGTMLEHGWPFLFQPANRWVQPTENCCTGASFLAELCAVGEARQLVLYSEGGANWYPDDTDFLRGASSSAWVDALTWLWDDIGVISHTVACEVVLSRVWDRWRISRG